MAVQEVTAGINEQYGAIVELYTIHCGKCGGTYAINERYRQKRYEEGNGWNCPYCECKWGYFTNNMKKELEQAKGKLQTELARHDQTRAALRETERRRRAEKGAKTRIKNRVKNGVCPCCNRYFANLHRHMENQHPDFTAVVPGDEAAK